MVYLNILMAIDIQITSRSRWRSVGPPLALLRYSDLLLLLRPSGLYDLLTRALNVRLYYYDLSSFIAPLYLHSTQKELLLLLLLVTLMKSYCISNKAKVWSGGSASEKWKCLLLNRKWRKVLGEPILMLLLLFLIFSPLRYIHHSAFMYTKGRIGEFRLILPMTTTTPF